MIAVAGVLVWIPVTEHPNHPRKCTVGDSYAYATEAECRRICDAWNAAGDRWNWHPLQVVVQQQGGNSGPQMRLL
jgi:hypothetical protein